jgi:hypothetical protein
VTSTSVLTSCPTYRRCGNTTTASLRSGSHTSTGSGARIPLIGSRRRKTASRFAPPNAGRFCSQFFHPEAEWVDALSLSWAAENNWVFPPTHLVGSSVAHLRACDAPATLICPEAPWAPWWPLLRRGTGWARDMQRVLPLGPAPAVLEISRRDSRLFGSGPVIAIRFGRS